MNRQLPLSSSVLSQVCPRESRIPWLPVVLVLTPLLTVFIGLLTAFITFTTAFITITTAIIDVAPEVIPVLRSSRQTQPDPIDKTAMEAKAEPSDSRSGQVSHVPVQLDEGDYVIVCKLPRTGSNSILSRIDPQEAENVMVASVEPDAERVSQPGILLEAAEPRLDPAIRIDEIPEEPDPVGPEERLLALRNAVWVSDELHDGGTFDRNGAFRQGILFVELLCDGSRANQLKCKSAWSNWTGDIHRARKSMDDVAAMGDKELLASLNRTANRLALENPSLWSELG